MTWLEINHGWVKINFLLEDEEILFFLFFLKNNKTENFLGEYLLLKKKFWGQIGNNELVFIFSSDGALRFNSIETIRIPLVYGSSLSTPWSCSVLRCTDRRSRVFVFPAAKCDLI